jgi:tetratricopeptide (TPR) repeat protein
MQLNREYKPRRRTKGMGRFWPLFILLFLAVIVYEQWNNHESEGSWLFRSFGGPTPTATLGAASFLVDAQGALAAGQYDRAIEALNRVVEMDPANADAHIELARLHLIFLELERSLESARTAVELAPENPEALNTLARALDWVGEYDDGMDYALSALDIDPDNATTLATIAEIYTDVGNWETAAEYIDQALLVDPRNVLALRNKAYLLERQGSYTDAVAAYQAALDSAPQRFDLYIEKARQYRIGLLDYEKANEAYRNAVEVYRSAVTLDALGDGLYNAGDHLAAVQVLRDAVELDPTYAPAQVHLGMALYARRNYEDAVTALEQGLPGLANPRIEQIYTAGLANVYKDPPDCPRAETWLRRALEIDPTSGPALDGLAACSLPAQAPAATP